MNFTDPIFPRRIQATSRSGCESNSNPISTRDFSADAAACAIQIQQACCITAARQTMTDIINTEMLTTNSTTFGRQGETGKPAVARPLSHYRCFRVATLIYRISTRVTNTHIEAGLDSEVQHLHFDHLQMAVRTLKVHDQI